MIIKKKTISNSFNEYEIEGDNGENIFLTIKVNSYPLEIWSGSAKGEKIRSQVKVVKAASNWLLEKLREEQLKNEKS